MDAPDHTTSPPAPPRPSSSRRAPPGPPGPDLGRGSPPPPRARGAPSSGEPPPPTGELPPRRRSPPPLPRAPLLLPPLSSSLSLSLVGQQERRSTAGSIHRDAMAAEASPALGSTQAAAPRATLARS